MRGKQLERLLTTEMQRNPSDLDLRGRALREAKLIPTGARGPHAPELSPSDAAAFLIGAVGARNATDAAAGVHVFGPLVPVGGPGESFREAKNFIDAVSTALADVSCAEEVLSIKLRLPFDLKRRRMVDVKDFPIAIIETQSIASNIIARSTYVPKFVAEKAVPRVGLNKFLDAGLDASIASIDHRVRVDGSLIITIAMALDPSFRSPELEDAAGDDASDREW